MNAFNRKNSFLRILPLVLLMFVSSTGHGASGRYYVSLNGTWQSATADAQLSSPPSRGWHEASVPSTQYSIKGNATWFRREFDVPKAWQGLRIHLRFNGVKYNSTILVNDKHVGGCFNGYDQFEVDITDAARVGGANTLIVGARDWTAVFEKIPSTPPKTTDFDALRRWPADQVLSPIGGRYGDYGIWDDVALVAMPPVHIADITIVSSFRKHTLTVTAEFVNDSKSTANLYWNNSVAGDSSVSFAERSVSLLPGKRTNLIVSAEWKKPKLWDHEHPNLYQLLSRLEVTESTAIRKRGDASSPALSTSQPNDELQTRFGFREFWVERGRFMLNGVPLTLRATAAWPLTVQDKNGASDIWRKTKEANCIAMRTHTQPWRQLFYDAADETGLLMVPEGAIWNDRESYRVEDDRFWKNYRDHLAAMWRRLKNNPSVVMWSLENEFYGTRCVAGTRGEIEMAKAGQYLKKLDPTRPITYESDGDPRLKPTDGTGVADVIGMHYPHEYPQFRLYPDTAWWLQHARIHKFFWPSDRFKWLHNKPLYIGEFLWLPSNNPSWHTLWFGDDAYLNYNEYRNRGKALSWRDQIIAYRTQGLNGIGPWTMFEGGPLGEKNHLWLAQKYAYHPIGAYLREADTRFFGGDKVERTAHIFNNTLSAGVVTFEWSIQANGKRIAGATSNIDLKADEHDAKSFTFIAPNPSERLDALLTIKTSMAGSPSFEDVKTLSFFPRSHVTVGPGIAIFGLGQRKLPAPLDRFREVKDLKELANSDVEVLVVLPNALDSLVTTNASPVTVISDSRAPLALLTRWIQRGGRALILAQNEVSSRALGIPFAAQTSTMTFAQNNQHAALKSITADDLKFWRDDGKCKDVLVEQDDLKKPSSTTGKPKRSPRKAGLIEAALDQHIVTTTEPVWSAHSGLIPIVVAGNRDGLSTAPLCEARRGKGVMLLSGLQLVEKFETEPSVRRILQNCLDYLDGYKGDTSDVICVSQAKSHLRPWLQRTGVRLAASSDLGTNSTSRIIIFEGERSSEIATDKLRSIATQGTTIWLHRPSQKAFDHVVKALALKGSLVQAHGPLKRATDLPSIAAGLSREDLWWLAEHKPYSWSEARQCRDSIASAVSGGSFTLLMNPGALAVAACGKATLLVDTFDESTQSARQNEAKLSRIFATLLANAGADFEANGAATVLSADQFTPVGEIKHFSREPGIVAIACNGKVTTRIQVAQGGKYRVTLNARGTPAAGQFPLVDVAVDGKSVGKIEANSYSFAPQDMTVTLSAGAHEFSLAFINDVSLNGEDRNLWVRSVEFELTKRSND